MIALKPPAIDRRVKRGLLDEVPAKGVSGSCSWIRYSNNGCDRGASGSTSLATSSVISPARSPEPSPDEGAAASSAAGPSTRKGFTLGTTGDERRRGREARRDGVPIVGHDFVPTNRRPKSTPSTTGPLHDRQHEMSRSRLRPASTAEEDRWLVLRPLEVDVERAARLAGDRFLSLLPHQ